MISLVHLLFGAAMGSAISSIPLAIILSLLGHYVLDAIPHIEYPIENIAKNQWQNSRPEFLNIIIDFLIGILLIFVFSKNQPIIYICAAIGVVPDGLTALYYFFPNKFLEAHNYFHEKIHFLKYKKISNFWRFLSQALVIIISIYLLIV